MTARSETDRVIYRRCCRATKKRIDNSHRDVFRRWLKGCNNSGEQWKIAKELLHAAGRDQTKSDSANQSLFSTFSSFVHSKIQAKKQTIITQLFFPNSFPLYYQPLTGSSISSFSPVTNVEALRLVTSCSSKFLPVDFNLSLLIKYTNSC